MAPRLVRCPLWMFALLACAGCFAPTFEARLAGADGGTHPGDGGTCIPSCAGKQCGADGCAGSCGGCSAGLYCGSSGQCGSCSDVALRCGSLCCGKDQKCVNGACIACGCGARVCGSDECGNYCGTCLGSQTCDWTGKCVGGTNKCQGVTCNTGEACDAADGLCKCAGGPDQGSCPANQVCSITKRCVPVQDLCVGVVCPSWAPVCKVGRCTCSQDSCGNGMRCNASGGCESACNPLCVMPTLLCDTSGPSPVCKCSGVGVQGSCDVGYLCNADGSCKPVCAGTVCGNKCCGVDQTCNAGVCGPPACNPATCPLGCCGAGACMSKSFAACGTGGSVCTACNTTLADNCGPSGACACGSGPVCGTGQTCTGGLCVISACLPACTTGEFCQGTTCVCIPGSKLGDPTNVPDSCATVTSNAFYCDATNHRCKSSQVQCNGTLCAPGQVCQDMDKFYGTGTPDMQCSCTPALTSGGQPFTPETCEIIGQACDMPLGDINSFNAQPSVCKKPPMYDACSKWGGCATGLTCSDLTYTSGVQDICVALCAGTSGCADPSMSCQAKYNVSACYENKCTTFFAACPAASSADGYCIPLPDEDASGNAVTKGVCYQTGTATTQCDPFATRSSPAGLCGQNAFCQRIQEVLPSTSPKTYKGLCRPVCNSATTSPGPVKTCTGSGTLCGDFSSWFTGGIPAGHTASEYHALPGLCETSCNPLGTNTCPAETVLSNPQGCQDYDGTNGICVAIMPGAGAVGAPCGSSTELRKECQGNLFCDDLYTSSSKTCATYCSTTTCPPSAMPPCTSCQPSTNQFCYPACFPSGFDLGAGNSAYCVVCCSGACTTSTSSICGTGGPAMPVVGSCLP